MRAYTKTQPVYTLLLNICYQKNCILKLKNKNPKNATRKKNKKGENVKKKQKRKKDENQEIEAIVLSIDVERERISLGIKQLQEDAFNEYTQLIFNTLN